MAHVVLRIEPAEIPDDALQRLAELASIKVSQGTFRSHLAPIFTMALDWHRYDLAKPKRQAIGQQLIKVEKAAARLLAELRKLDEGGVRALGLSTLRCSEFGNTDDFATHIFQTNDLIETGDGITRGKDLLQRYVKDTDVIRLGANSYEFRSSGGAPTTSPTVPGNPRTSAEDLFILLVFRLVHQCGGRLTLNKNDGGGTAVKFFTLASAYLPSTFRLKGLGLSRLQFLRQYATGQEPIKK
jgi:hypothetical protein